MADDPGRAIDSSAGDLALLESGNFADVEIICGDRTWKCHRATLVPRSVWFEKALAGPFEEASTRQVKLNEENPVCIELALKFIYGRGLDVQSSISSEHFMEHCVSLWHIADFLLLSPLKSSVEKAVYNECDKRAKQLFTCPVNTIWYENGEITPWALDFVSGLRDAYKWNTSYLKSVLLEFLWVGRRPTFSPDMLDLFKDTPTIMSDLLCKYACRPWMLDAVWASRREVESESGACLGCAKLLPWARPAGTADKFTGVLLDPFNFDCHNRPTRGWCAKCASLNTIPWRI